MQKITSCPQCNENNFILIEKNYWRAYFDENGELNCHKPDNEIVVISCAECGKNLPNKVKYDEVINFN